MKKTIITLLALGSVAMAAPITEEFSLADAASVQLANQYDMGQSWTLSFNFTISPSTQKRSLTIISTDPAMPQGVKFAAFTSPNLPRFYVAGDEVIQDCRDWKNGGELTCTMAYDAAKEALTIKYGNATWSKNKTFSNVDFSSKVLTMFTTDLSDPNLGSGWGISGGTFTGEVIAAPEPDAHVVPEPTTATLSLLALAGLAARRRRSK